MPGPETLEKPLVRVDPATRFVRGLPGGPWTMLREAAHELGVSEYVLRKFIADGEPGCTPSKFTMFGKVKIYLYTKDDIKAIGKHLAGRGVVYEHDGQARRIGRPPKYNDTERKWRDKQHTRKWYWNNRVAILTERGDDEGAQAAKQMVESIEKELRKK